MTTEERAYYDEVHRVRVPKPLDGEKLGLTVQQHDGCVVVTRILSGGLVDQVVSIVYFILPLYFTCNSSFQSNIN